MHIGNLAESNYDYTPKLGCLVPENKQKNMHHSVDLNENFEEDFQQLKQNEKNEGNDQVIDYEEAKDAVEIDEKIEFLEEIEEGFSDGEESDNSEVKPNPPLDLLCQEAFEQPHQKNIDENKVEVQAQEIVDQMKELLISQLQKNFKNESNAHYGIK